jgi:hypothetical protein
MADSAAVAQFCELTGANDDVARQFLAGSDLQVRLMMTCRTLCGRVGGLNRYHPRPPSHLTLPHKRRMTIPWTTMMTLWVRHQAVKRRLILPQEVSPGRGSPSRLGCNSQTLSELPYPSFIVR